MPDVDWKATAKDIRHRNFPVLILPALLFVGIGLTTMLNPSEENPFAYGVMALVIGALLTLWSWRVSSRRPRRG